MSLWIKICANTTLEDALVAAEAGADAVGFVFAPSKRRVTVEQVACITPGLPAALEKIGVFVNVSAEEAAETANRCGLTGVQLHFAAPLALTASLRKILGDQKKILRVLHYGQAAPENFPVLLADPNVDAFLVDSHSAQGAGGTGETFDWMAASQTLFQNAQQRRLVVAGGLHPENVAEAIRILQPYGVDVASGVEAAPGHKDPAKVRAFIARARRL
ncbi:phosphoribosylanthranilate isomerase [Telmatobacter bradus]|uniref:phosphoribosylanthranilate isomerase n=1 Tax=Telmatobacter bradus TaxID=474953 RepID=UPI003B431D0F